MKFMKKLLSCVTSAEYAVMAAAFIAMVASYFISVLNRNFIQASMPWTEEIAVYSMTYMALLGTEVGLRDGTQVAVTAVVDKLHGVIRKIVDLIRGCSAATASPSWCTAAADGSATRTRSW